MPDPAGEIIKAAKNGQVARLKELLADDPALIDARDKDGSTSLHCATWKGQREVAALLIKAGADVNAHNNNDNWRKFSLVRPNPGKLSASFSPRRRGRLERCNY